MDRQIVLQHLAMAKRHVAQGIIHLAKQEALIVELERHGHDSADARAILATMNADPGEPRARSRPHSEAIGGLTPG